MAAAEILCTMKSLRKGERLGCKNVIKRGGSQGLRTLLYGVHYTWDIGQSRQSRTGQR